MDINGDLIPVASGWSNLGVDVSPNGQDAFDISTLAPFGQIHMVSGVFHDPIMGQSGVIRYNRQRAAFQTSVDGGLTFFDIATGATVVTSVGVLGDVNLTGDVDFATPASGFITIQDSGDASPLLWSVDTLGLSGLWQFPSQGFNGRIVNALTDFNGTEAQGVINVVGASGIVVDIIGQTLTISPGPSGGFATCHVQAFSSAVSWSVAHNLNTPHFTYSIWNNSSKAIIPDSVTIINPNQFTVTFNVAQAGKVVVIACRNIF